MNDVNFNSAVFMNTKDYQDFINKNPEKGYLNIRAYAANSAIPIGGLEVIVSKIINNRRVIFFQGATDNSGIISQIALPTPTVSSNDEEVPPSEDYDITATYNGNNLLFKINMYSNIQVLQNINIVPGLRLDGSSYGG